MKKNSVKLLLLTLFIVVLFACSPKNELSEEFKVVADNCSEIFLTLDEDGYRVDEVLKVVESYLQEEKSYEDAVKFLEDALYEITEISKNQQEFVVDEAMVECLQAYEISVEEYKDFGNLRSHELHNQSQTVFLLLELLTYADFSDWDYSNLQQAYDLQTVYQEEIRIYYYYMCLNYWFKNATESEMEYLQENIIDKIKCYRPEDAVWYTEEKELEDTVTLCLDRIEANNDEWIAILSIEREELYDMENLLEQLKALAEKRAELERKKQELKEAQERLEELKQINARILEIDAEAQKAKEEGDEETFEELKKEYEALVKRWDEIKAESEKAKQD